jgi:hypothetical protein
MVWSEIVENVEIELNGQCTEGAGVRMRVES